VVENLKFHRGVNYVIPINKRRSRFDFVKKIRVIAHLFELHKDVEELNSVFAADAIDLIDISCYDPFVELFLNLSKTKEHVDFFFLWQIVLHVYF